MTDERPDPVQEREAVPKIEQLERAVRDLTPESEDALNRVDSALAHLAAATADLEAIRSIERLARR